MPEPKIPDELWMLHDTLDGSWIVSIDDATEGNTFLVSLSEAAARAAAAHQKELYDLDCVPVRVK